MSRLVALVVSLLLVAPSLASPTTAQASHCQFELGFLSLQSMIPEQVGDCVTNVQYNPANGDALQPTTGPNGRGGLLVWRKSDNFTAFTDGFNTWVNGPFGLQRRLNSQRFFWERNLENLTIVPPPSPGERCHTAGLAVEVEQVSGAAGNIFGTFSLRNTQQVACSLFGFVGVQLRDAQNNALPTNAVRGGGPLADLPPPAIVVLRPGVSATFQLHWGNVSTGNEIICPTASQLAVTPPDEFSSIPIPISVTVCGGRINVSPVLAPTGISNNWSGYVATGASYTAITGTWTVPQSRSTTPSASASWVGIGGFRTRDLIQAGTDTIVHSPDDIQYGAWYELLPAPPVTVPLAVRPGDSMTVAIAMQSGNQWLITLTNNTTGRRFQTTVSYASSLSSADWIHEAPSFRGRILPLEEFGTVTFGGGMAVANGQPQTIEQAGAQAISMISELGEIIAIPSPLAPSGSGFSVSKS